MDHIILHVSYRCKSGTAMDFVRAIKDSGVQALVRAEDGCMQYDYHLSLEENDTAVLLEKWRDGDALAAHLQQPHMQTLKQLKERFVCDTIIERFRGIPE